jgi:hypothetical protein
VLWPKLWRNLNSKLSKDYYEWRLQLRRDFYHAYLAFRKAKYGLKLLNLFDAFCVDESQARGPFRTAKIGNTRAGFLLLSIRQTKAIYLNTYL